MGREPQVLEPRPDGGLLGACLLSFTAPRSFSGGSMPGLWRPRLPSAWTLLLLPFLWLLMPAAPAPHRGSYKPVIVVHGLFDSSYSFRHLLDYINEVCRGTPAGGCWNSYTGRGKKRGAAERRPLQARSSGESWEAGLPLPASTANTRASTGQPQWLHCPLPTDAPRDCGDSA